MAYPEWKPEEHPRYDEIMERTCAVDLAALTGADKAALVVFMRDTRQAHAKLYADLTPDGYAEYAGTYRGTPGSSLETRRLLTTKSDGTDLEHTAPAEVAAGLATLDKVVDRIESSPDDQHPVISLKSAIMLFRFFGLLHPFLDGNGHVQRLLFAAAIERFPKLTLRPEWTIHPRPYDQERMKVAFEATGDGEPLKSLLAVLRPYVEFDAPVQAVEVDS